MSGMSLIGVTLMFFLSGGNVVPAIILGVAVCIGIGQCADMMGDLKSGHLIGAKPKKQQLAQLMVCWVGVPVAVGTVVLLWGDGGGFGPGNAELSAPQGTALAAIMESLRAGAAPLDKYVAGGAIGLGLGLHPVGGLGVLIGLAILPSSLRSGPVGHCRDTSKLARKVTHRGLDRRHELHQKERGAQGR